MKKINRVTLKSALLAAIFSSSLLAGNAQAHDDFDDVFSAIIPIIVYEAITQPRVIVHKKRIIREGYLKPRYGRKSRYDRYDRYSRYGRHDRETHKHRKHRRSVSHDYYRHPQRGRHHDHF